MRGGGSGGGKGTREHTSKIELKFSCLEINLSSHFGKLFAVDDNYAPLSTTIQLLFLKHMPLYLHGMEARIFESQKDNFVPHHFPHAPFPSPIPSASNPIPPSHPLCSFPVLEKLYLHL